MDAVTILLIALGLAMDSFSVSITSGLAIKNPRISNALKIGVFFGFFQAFMPVRMVRRVQHERFYFRY